MIVNWDALLSEQPWLFPNADIVRDWTEEEQQHSGGQKGWCCAEWGSSTVSGGEEGGDNRTGAEMRGGRKRELAPPCPHRVHCSGQLQSWGIRCPAVECFEGDIIVPVNATGEQRLC